MRVIKFRAWNKFKSEMYDPMPIIDFTLVRINAVILMQFTGLLDKNGKEIYEGDIVANEDYVENAHAWQDIGQRQIEWDNDNSSFIGMNGEKITVIGNIYETPELLNNHD